MFRIRALIAMGVVWLAFTKGSAQGFVENALTFSEPVISGSARIQALGGASVALGGDFTSAMSNPAGLGMYNRSEFSFTPAINTYRADAAYLGNGDLENKTVFNIPGLGLIFHQPKDKDGFLGGSFAVTLTRTHDFQFEGYYHGTNNNSSIIDYFVDNADGKTTDAFLEGGVDYNDPTGLSYHTYLIGPISTFDPDYPNGDITYFTWEHTIPDQQEEILTKGAVNEWNFAYGGNYNDRIFFGASLGISSLRYKNKKNYHETFYSDTLNSVDLTETVDIRGSGINLSVGVITRPVNFLQVGASITTPTFYTLTDNYYASLTADWNLFDYYGDGSEILGLRTAALDPEGLISEYNLTTPFKFRTGFALISKMGFFTADVEFVNPAQTRYSSETTGISFHPENESIRNVFQSVASYHMGAEFRYEILRVRAGFAHVGNPITTAYNEDQSITTFTGGLGIRTRSFFADFAMTSSLASRRYSPYVFSDGTGPVVNFDNTGMHYLFTVGFTY